MRTTVSIFLILSGLASAYLFASGALVRSDGPWAWSRVVERAIQPFVLADSFALLVLSLGLGVLVVGLVISQRAAAPVRAGRESAAPNSVAYLTGDRLLETGLVINTMVVASILTLISIAMLQPTPPPPATLGSLFVVAAVEVVLGVAVALYLFQRRPRELRKWRSVFAFSAMLNLTEGALLSFILVLGFV